MGSRSGGGSMERNLRWAVAALVTLAAVAVPTWLCGAVVLPPLLKDGAIRWGLAGVVGVALAALAALWGHSYATGTEKKEGPVLPRLQVQATAQGAVAVGGNNPGTISTGTSTPPATPTQPAPGNPPAQPSASQANTVTASAERSVAIGGDNSGQVSTGDQPGSAAP
jgi:hypothetical protein